MVPLWYHGAILICVLFINPYLGFSRCFLFSDYVFLLYYLKLSTGSGFYNSSNIAKLISNFEVRINRKDFGLHLVFAPCLT